MLLIVQIHSHIIVLFSSSCADSLLTEQEHLVATHYGRGEVTCSFFDSLPTRKLSPSLQERLVQSMNQQSRTEASSVPGRWHRQWPLRIAYPYLASVVTALSRFLQLSAPARHGKTWHHLFLYIVCVGCQRVLIYTWCILSYASLGFTLSVWDSCHLHGPDKWACTQCELRS